MSGALDPDRFRLSEAKHQQIFERFVVRHVFGGAAPSSRPVAVVFGGQPGSGKSAAVQQAVAELRSRDGAAVLVGDDLRPFQPQYSRLLRKDDSTAAFYTDRDTAGWIEKSIAYARDRRYSIVIEGTMRDAGKVAETLTGFRAAGFDLDTRGLAVNARLSQLGILERYEQQRAIRGSGRLTVEAAHDAAFQGMPVTVDRIEREGLSDRLRLFTRSQVAVFDNRGAGGTVATGARAALEAERSRPLSIGETQQLVAGYSRVADWMAERKAPPMDRALVADRLNIARRELQQLRALDQDRNHSR